MAGESFVLSCRLIKQMCMKQLSLILNVVLLIAVGFLYYKVFASPNKITNTSKIAASSIQNKPGQRPLIAYVELDSLNENIVQIREKRKELEGEQRAIETEWQNSYRGLENQKNNFLKRGQSITQQEAEEFQGKLIQQQQQVDGKKQALTQKLSEKSYKFMDDIQKRLKEFLNDYNKEKNYMYILTTGTGLDYMVYKDSTLNITNDVIQGMNDKMKQKVKK